MPTRKPPFRVSAGDETLIRQMAHGLAFAPPQTTILHAPKDERQIKLYKDVKSKFWIYGPDRKMYKLELVINLELQDESPYD